MKSHHPLNEQNTELYSDDIRLLLITWKTPQSTSNFGSALKTSLRKLQHWNLVEIYEDEVSNRWMSKTTEKGQVMCMNIITYVNTNR